LIELYQTQLEHRVGNAADLHVNIARIAALHLQDVPRAFDELHQALDLQKQHEGAIAELERLLADAPEAEHRARAASLLEPVYLQRADFGKVMTAMRARLEFTGDPEERRELLSRLAKLYEEQKEDYVAALETVAKLFHDDPGNETTTSELERLAKVSGSEARLAEIYATEIDEFHGDDPVSARLSRRAGELFAVLGESERALGFYRRALAFEPESKALFEATDALLAKMARPGERVELHREALDHRFDPKDRLDLLHTIAALQRRELGQPDAAIETYRAALEVSETDTRALDALTELYREKSQWHDLAELYLRRAEESTNPERAAEYRLALARLQRRELSDIDRALDQLEEIVRFAPAHAEAIAELESLREDPTVKQRVVEILRPLYESADDWRHLIKLNEDRFTLAENNADKVTVLSETAHLWERRGGDLDRARRALAVAFKLDPDDAQVRAEYERLTGATRAWDQLAETYEEALAETPDLISKRDILAVLANVHDEKRDDPRRALGAYDRLREADETELGPLDKMEQLATLLSDWPILVRALTAKTELVEDDAERASLWRRIGEAKRDMLDDRDGAVAAYEQAFELEADSAFTVDCLIDLYETEKNPNRLVELYERRVELSDEDDADLKYTLLMSAARSYETDLVDRTRAIERLNDVLALRPGDPEALRARGRLYRDEEMWPELLENSRLEAEQAESGRPRAAIEQQMGRILAEKLGRYEDALEAYQRALKDAPDDAQTVAAVEEIGTDHDDLKVQVAEILVPVLRDTKRHDELVKVLEMRLGVESEPQQRAETLESIAQVLERELGRPHEAQRALLRALVEQPESEELHRENERLAELADGWALYADALAERAASTFDPEIAKALYVRVGKVADEKLRDERRAVDAYGRAIEQVGDQPELLAALDRLYTRIGDAQALSEVLERRVAVEEGDAAQAELYYRLATVQIRDFAEPARGLGSLRMAIERAPDHEGAAAELEKLTEHRDLFEEAADVLESVYRSRSRADKLPVLYEKRVAFADGADERVDTRLRLARVLEEDCAEPAAAQRAVEQALGDDPAADRVREELERLAAITGDWQGAARAMVAAVEQRAELPPQVASELLMHVSQWLAERASDSAGAEQALRKALEIDPQNDAVLERLEELQRAAGRDADLSVTLRTRGRLQQDPQAREELFRRARDLALRQAGPDAGEPVLRELLELDETNLWALAELTEIRENAGDYAETFQLVARRAELGADGTAVRQLRKKAAQIARDRLAQPARASELYEHLFEDDPNDAESARALRELYEERQSFDKLGRLLERLIDLAESPEERTSLRIELARLNDQRFESSATAIELLRAGLDEQPGHAEAVVALSELYERTGRDEELAELLDEQIALAREKNDVDSELRLQVRLGDIYESRLSDRAKAIETYQGVLERDPQQRSALEALARLFEADNKPAEAAKVLERLLEGSEGARTVELSTALADTYSRLGDNEKAARALERGLVADERNAALRERLAELYTAAGSWEQLANLIARDAELSENDEVKARLLRQAAKIHAQKRQSFGQAAELLERASQIKPDDRELLLELCDAYSASGRGSAAAAVLERIVQSYAGRRSKELGEIHRRLADAYLADNDVTRALEELDRAFKIEPSNVHVLKKISDVAMTAGDYKKAQLVLRALMMQKLDQGSPITRAEVFMRIAEVHEKLGEREKAIQMLERSLQADDKLSAARERLAVLRAG
jgi:tetratricopeptide (TPR) repeat protein